MSEDTHTSTRPLAPHLTPLLNLFTHNITTHIKKVSPEDTPAAHLRSMLDFGKSCRDRFIQSQIVVSESHL